MGSGRFNAAVLFALGKLIQDNKLFDKKQTRGPHSLRIFLSLEQSNHFYTRVISRTISGLFIFFCISTPECISQTYSSYAEYNLFYEVTVGSAANCEEGTASCTENYISQMSTGLQGSTYTPEGFLYFIGPDLYEVNQSTGFLTLVFDIPQPPIMLLGLLGVGNGIFYVIGSGFNEPDSLYKIDLNANTFTNEGLVPYEVGGGFCMFNGEAYCTTWIGSGPVQNIIKLDLTDPSLSELVTPLETFVDGISASNKCNTLIAIVDWEHNPELVQVNLIDGAVTHICSTEAHHIVITSMQEFATVAGCSIQFDLDCNDSSGAIEADFNADEIDCLDNESTVADIDIGMEYDAIISEMRIEITGFIPDAPFEILTSTGSVPNIGVIGDGTDMITLTNEGGARSTDFKDALRQIRYQNNAESPTAGLRTVEVQFETQSGSESNVATAFINVVELPHVPVDLGDDMQICEGGTVTFDTGIQGAEYEWSNGEDTQSITVDASGEYSVTVSDDENCPGSDTVLLEVLPVIDVSISGDIEICDNEPVNLTINTDSPFSLSIDISSNPGSPFSLPNVNGNTSFTDLINEETTYTITSVTPSQDACITITDPEHIVDVFPSFNHAFEVSICDGDSVWLGFYWETEDGVYENTFASFDGCDSVVTTTINVVSSINLTAQGTTCDSAEVGIFITTIDNPNGCDTIMTTTVTLSPSDTTQQNLTTCVLANAGTITQVLTNIQGCDSLVIAYTTYQAPADTTFTSATTCDSALLGISQLLMPAQDGCDSLIVINTTFSPSDTTYAFGTSCDSSLIGIFQSLLQNQGGCDSLVITTINAGLPDTTYVFNTSCDSASLGEFEMHYISQMGCDSVVFNTVTYSAHDSTFITGSTCDPSSAGVTVQTFINQFGCDSIVTTTIALLPSDTIAITGTTCDPVEEGTNIQELQNIYGCDSIVTTTITLLPSSQTNLFGSTCVSSQAGVFVSTLINQHGCDSIITLMVSLVDADTTQLNYMTCFENEVGIIESLYTSQDGCDSLVIENTLLFPPFTFHLESVFDFNGYDISCVGASDGSVSAIVSGTEPFSYEWSTMADEQTITGLAAGDYAVTITDGNGCMESGAITLTEPSAFALAFELSEPGCFDNELGIINVIATGGVAPYSYSINGTNFQTTSVFENLQNGVYEIKALDANDCEATEIISIHVPLSIQVELSDDQIIAIGDSAEITALINLPFDSITNIQWTGIDSIECANCLTQIVAPIITTAYSVTVSSVDGCTDSDSMTVYVSINHQFYVPNIFSPNGDGINDVITVYTSDDVEAILLFAIFDRWGNSVFEINGEANVIEWDGKFNGKTMNPGVFTYLAKVKYKDGLVEMRYGDITLIR